MASYRDLCYSPFISGHTNSSRYGVQPSASFEVWYNGDFGLCFEYLTFSAFLGALFCVVSALYAGCKHTNIRRNRKPCALIIRGAISLSIMLTFIVDLVASFWLSPGLPYSLLVALAVQILAWAVHMYCLWVLSYSINHYGRGPLNLNAAWILTFVGSILQLRSTIRWKQNPAVYERSSLPIEEAYFSHLSEIVVYIVFSLHCLYAISLTLKVSKVTGDNVTLKPALYRWRNRRKTEWTDVADKSVNEHLISSEWMVENEPYSYSSFSRPYMFSVNGLEDGTFGNLDASEDNANILSCLLFWWVEPLMRRGGLGFLKKPEDLIHLPKSLDTCRIREKFRKTRVMGNTQRKDSNEIQSATVDEDGTSDAVSTSNGEFLCGEFVNGVEFEAGQYENTLDDTNHEDSSSLLEESNELDEPRTKEELTEEPGVDRAGPSLFWSLNRTFGLHFYPLGVLKLVADMLGFAGPLLLHALVSFMEEKKVSMLLCTVHSSHRSCEVPQAHREELISIYNIQLLF